MAKKDNNKINDRKTGVNVYLEQPKFIKMNIFLVTLIAMLLLGTQII